MIRQRAYSASGSNKISWWGMTIGLLWFAVCATSGTYFLQSELSAKSSLNGLFLPFYIVIWLLAFFFGRVGISWLAAAIGVPLVVETMNRPPESTRPRESDPSVLIAGKFPVTSSKAVPAWRLIAGGPASRMLFLVLLAMAAAVIFGAGRIPSVFAYLPVRNDFESMSIPLRKLPLTFLVYFMQFGFIAFEAGAVRQNYRRQSAIKNLVVFAVSFVSYMFVGWHIQHALNETAVSSLLDIMFNAGFASTVALIIANAMTERGTILVNVLCAYVAGLAYPCLAGLAFKGGILTKLNFIDTAGGCVVHVLGGTFGLVAALLIGPRAERRIWRYLGKAQMLEQFEPRNSIHLSVIGAFFLWFGWLGFNTGNAANWHDFLVALMNTNIGASVGGLVGLIVAVTSIGMLTMRTSSQSWTGSGAQELLIETGNLDRVVYGMMGGLVAVTANASLVKPSQAFLEAAFGAVVAIVGSAVIARFGTRLDDPLGATATHALAGIVGILCTAWFCENRSLSVQALGCLAAVAIGATLALVPCAFLWSLEQLRGVNEIWLYGRLLRLTPYQERTGKLGTEFLEPDEAVERAKARLRS